MERTKPMVIGVAGGSGSGKTTIINAITEELDKNDFVTLQHDAYYKNINHLPLLERERTNYDHPDALATDLLISHVRDLLDWKEVEAPIYNFATHSREDSGIIKKPAKLVIVDGILIFVEKALRELMDVKLFVSTDNDIRFIRRLKRDIMERGRSMDSVVNQYLETVRPMHIAFVEPSRIFADIIIPEGRNPVSVKMVVSMMQKQLSTVNK